MTMKHRLLALAIGIALQSAAAAAWAAPSGDDQNPADEAQTRPPAAPISLDEVMVTARKRSESELAVPVVMSVITRESLERTQADDIFAIATQVPGLLLGNAVNSAGTQLSLRGVGTTALNTIMDQSVSLNIDGLPLSQGVAYSAGMFDVGQVEVLKGPQALFFGKNSPAGVISLRSADPTSEFEASVRAGYEREAEEKVFEAVLSGPVNDILSLRLAARYSDQEGFFRNEAVATPGLGGRTPEYDNYAPTESQIVRGTVLFAPTEGYGARLKLNYTNSEVRGGASPLQLGYCPDGTGAVPPVNVPFIAGDDCRIDRVLRLAWPDPAAFPAGFPRGVQFEDNSQLFGSLEQNFYFGDELSLTSVTGYYDNDYETVHSGSATSATVPFLNHITFGNKQFTQELRLTSDYAEKPVNFMFGAFYQNGEQSNEVRIPTNANFGLPPILQHVLHDVDIESTSVFGQVLWDITPELELAAGARWTNEKRHHREFNFNATQGPIGEVERPDPKLDSSNVSPEVSLTWKPSDRLTWFASYKTGFKSGSFGTANYVSPTTRASFEDEEVKGGEIGLKTRSADGRLSANVAAYKYDYTDLQVGAMELALLPGGGYIFTSRTINAASATVKGVEFDVNYSPAGIDGLNLTAALNYNRARYTSFPNGPCGNGQTIAEGCDQLFNESTGRYMAQDLSGRRLVRAPEWSAYAGISHEVAIGGERTLAFGAGANYTSEYSTTLVDLPGFEQDAFVKVNANVALRGPEDRWEVALIGNNLGNELVRGWCVNSNVQNGTVFGGQIAGAETGGPAGGDEAACFIERGREVWARFTWNF